MSCHDCKLKVSYYENNKIKYIHCSYCNLKINFCKECGSTNIIWEDLDIVCRTCGLVHETTSVYSESIKEDIPIKLL